MSRNIFNAIGPIGQGMGKIGDASLCGTETYPIGLTGPELVEWYWKTRKITLACSAVATQEPSYSAFFSSTTVNGPFNGDLTRDMLIRNGGWAAEMYASPAADPGFGSAIMQFFMFFDSPTMAFDGTLYYPSMFLGVSMSAQDKGEHGFSSSSLGMTSRITSSDPTIYTEVGSANVMGKTLPLRFYTDPDPGGFGDATYSPPSVSKNSDWPYT